MMSSFGSDRLSTETFWRLFTVGVGRLPKDFQGSRWPKARKVWRTTSVLNYKLDFYLFL